MPLKNSSAAITSPLALDEYAKSVERLNYYAYLLMQLILETGFYQSKAFEMKVSDMISSLTLSANGKTYYFCKNPISKELYEKLHAACENRSKNEAFFLHASGDPLTKMGFRTVLEQAGNVNPSYNLNALTLRKTYYWHEYNRSTNRAEFLRKLQLHDEVSAAEYFGVPVETIVMKSGVSARSQIFSSTIVQDTFEKVEKTIDEIKNDYTSVIHTDAYYESLRILLNSLDSSIAEYQIATKDVL